ncbi:MAG: FtsX-like permease family protein [Candidatus Symbiothrix sp.]|jgi:lipoprotein-releasing system permease protein|nr:FtsX-like permease family protein [Candidatus Symbiothrix sp.]
MDSEFFIAKRIYGNRVGERNVSPPAIRVAIVSMTLGLAVMLLSVFIVTGFKKEVRNKVIGFGSHIQVTNFNNTSLYEPQPIAVSDSLQNKLQAYPNVRHVEKFASKMGIIKTDHDSQGVIFKGVDENYDWYFFKQNLIEGDILTVRPDSATTNVLISQNISAKLNLKPNDSFNTYFIADQGQVRARKFHITGIYKSYFSDFDKLFILADIKQIQRLNQWETDMVSGLEILVKDYGRLDETAENIYYELFNKNDRLGNNLYTRSIKQLKPEIFEWLAVLDTNVVIILVLMLFVAGFSMISGLLIIILERANMIGILKALGYNNTNIRKIFLYVSTFLIGKGLLWGNLIALSVCAVQKITGILKLNPDVYYLSEVPFELNIVSILLINLGTLLVTLLMLIGPSYLIAKISPAKTIRFE